MFNKPDPVSGEAKKSVYGPWMGATRARDFVAPEPRSIRSIDRRRKTERVTARTRR
jgi:hypothetical protein